MRVVLDAARGVVNAERRRCLALMALTDAATQRRAIRMYGSVEAWRYLASAKILELDSAAAAASRPTVPERQRCAAL